MKTDAEITTEKMIAEREKFLTWWATQMAERMFEIGVAHLKDVERENRLRAITTRKNFAVAADNSQKVSSFDGWAKKYA